MDDVKSPLLDTSTDSTSDSEDDEVLETVDVDGALEQIGYWGNFNILLLTMLTFCETAILFQLTFSYFIGNDPPWKCASSPGNTSPTLNSDNASNFCMQHPGKEVHVDDADFYKRCHLTRQQWTYSAEKTYSYTTEFDLVCGKSMLNALISAAFFCGLVVNLFLAPMADICGRKRTLVGILFIAIIASICFSYARKVRYGHSDLNYLIKLLNYRISSI